MEEFEKLNLPEELLKSLKAKNITKPTKIQELAIPLILKEKDVIGGSATGSGKTLAFGAGIIKRLDNSGKIKALILTPTRELAEQVSRSLEEFAYLKKLDVTPIYGGVSMNNQIKRLANTDIVVATPGRLLDHLENTNSIDLSHVEFLVLDEADRMWDMGFRDDVEKIVKHCPKKRQTLLFSATITKELEDFSNKYMNDPKEVAVESQVDPSKLKQIYYDVKDNEKFSLLVHLLKKENAHLVMIFCNSRRNVDIVTKNLKNQKISAQSIHGGLSQLKRNQVIKNFDNSKVNVLVATDVAARGLDISGVSHVYNYDVPMDPKDYVHRVGRTARAGNDGIAINILASKDYDNFANVQRNFPEISIKNEMTPRFEKVFVKIERDENRRDNRKGQSRNNFRKNPGKRTDSRGPRRSRGPESREGSKSRRTQNKPYSRDKRKTGFHGSSRSTKRSFNKKR